MVTVGVMSLGGQQLSPAVNYAREPALGEWILEGNQWAQVLAVSHVGGPAPRILVWTGPTAPVPAASSRPL